MLRSRGANRVAIAGKAEEWGRRAAAESASEPVQKKTAATGGGEFEGGEEEGVR
jgi:hypothetical protein